MEIEFKYNASEISLSTFTEFCQERNRKNVHKFIIASGYDYFYDSLTNPESFCRHRVGADMNQLTFKKKTSGTNNYVRTEHNIDLENKVSVEQVKLLCGEFGYKYNTSIFKNCFIYAYDRYTLVYYVCYDKDMKELGRFVEIEMKEDHNWSSEEEAYGELTIMEKLCKGLGISSKSRLKRSLYEMFKE